MRQDLRAVLRDVQHVFDSHAAETFEVNAGFAGHDLARRKLAFAQIRNARRLVNIHSDAVTEAVTEKRAKTGFADDVARDFVGLEIPGRIASEAATCAR